MAEPTIYSHAGEAREEIASGEDASDISTLRRFAFRAEKRIKHARVLTFRKAPSLKKWRDFVETKNRVANFIGFPNSPGKQQHFHVFKES